MWTDIAGATNSTYTLAVADEDSLVRLRVTATDQLGAARVDDRPDPRRRRPAAPLTPAADPGALSPRL